METEKNDKVMVLIAPLENRRGNSCGTEYLIFAQRPTDARAWLEANIGLNPPRGTVRHQVRITVFTPYDDNWEPVDESPLWTLIESYINGIIGTQDFETVARLRG